MTASDSADMTAMPAATMPAATLPTGRPPLAGTDAAAIGSAERPLIGIALICCAVLCWVTMNTQVQLLTESLPVPVIIWGRYFFHFALILVLLPWRIPTLLVSERVGLQVLRSILVLGATSCMYTGLAFVPLAELVAITFVGPILITGLSVVILGETVGIRRWAAVIVGFAGVLVILRPGLDAFQPAGLFAVGSALCYAFYQITTRVMRHAATPLTALFYTAMVGAAVMSALLPAMVFAGPAIRAAAPVAGIIPEVWWQMPEWWQWGLLVSAGFFGGLGHFAMIRAVSAAPASTVAPFQYTELIWATLFGFAVFGHLPDALTYVGAAIVAGSGLYILHRERVKAASQA